MSHHGTEIKTISHLLCSRQYFGQLAVGSFTFSILQPCSSLNPSLQETSLDCKWGQAEEWVNWRDQIGDGHCSCFQAARRAGMDDWWIAIVHSLALSVTPDVGRGLPPPPTPHKHKACHGLIEWLNTEWYLLLQLSILTTLLLANIKMDHNIYVTQVKCERIWAASHPPNYVICSFTFLTEKCIHLRISPEHQVS